MSNWKIVEPEGDGSKEAIVSIYSNKMILEEYYDFWCKLMKKANKEHLISDKACIEDWITVNWAEPTNEPISTYKVDLK